MNTNNKEIRVLTTMEELIEVQKIEYAVWKMNPIPLHQTFTALKNGGILLGAFNHNRMIGYLYSFPGFDAGAVHLCSHMLGILPAYQVDGLGEKMKIKQAEIARELGYPMITWTFDPLESRNAYLNLHKLGAIGASYEPNYYGAMHDGLNEGLPSDRIKIHWNMSEIKQKQTHYFERRKLLLDAGEDGAPIVTEVYKRADFHEENVYFIAIPTGFQEIKQADFELAKQWRLKTRDVFQTLFDEGLQATDLLRDHERSLCYYVFTK